MDTSTSELVKNAAGSFVRWMLVLIAGILVKKGIITNAQGETYVATALPVAIGGVMALIALGWSLYQKKLANKKIDVALTLPAGANRTVLENKVASQ